MLPEEDLQVVQAVAEALEQPPETREAFLEHSIGPDSTRLAEAQSLLAFHRKEGALDGETTQVLSGFAVNAVIGNRFQIVRFIGHGGMGDVYEATDLAQSRRPRVALKTIRPDIASSPGALDQFEREIEIGKTITDRNVCRIYDLGIHREPPDRDTPHLLKPATLFLTMELLDGENLAECLRRRKLLPLSEALPLIGQIALAVDAAHRAKIVHRDLKPGNIMLVPGKDESGLRAVVMDFGLARDFGTGAAQMTMAGTGTPDYMSPEQVRGDPTGPASDIYSLGVVAYQVVSGKLPFEGPNPLARMLKRLDAAPVPVRARQPSLPEFWETALLRCLERDPSNRFSTALDFVHALESDAVSQPAAPLEKGAKPGWMSLRWKLLAGAACALLASAVLALWIEKNFLAPAAHHRRSVAVVGFRNLTGAPASDWVSTGLTEGIRTQLAANGKLRTISAQDVSDMNRDLGIARFDSLGKDTLARVRKYGAELVVVGSYTDLNGRINLNLELQDTGKQETIDSLPAEGTESEIAVLVEQVGARLRAKLGLEELTPGRERQLALSQPQPEAAPAYSEGVARLRVHDALAAQALLEKASVIDPHFPLAHHALASAWSVLGYDERARAEARKAFELAGKLSLEDRLVIEGQFRELTRDWPAALATFDQLHRYYPDNLEYGLAVARAQRFAGNLTSALDTLQSLRRGPAEQAKDPRIDLFEAETATASGDFPRALAAAEAGLTKARDIGARMLEERSVYWKCAALRNKGDLVPAQAACLTAVEKARLIDDRLGTARALSGLGNCLRLQNDPRGAQSRFEEAIAITRALGTKLDNAGALNNLAMVLSAQSQYQQAAKSYNEALAIQKEIGVKSEQARTLNNLCQLYTTQLRWPQAESACKEAIQLATEVGSRRSQEIGLTQLGTLYQKQGRRADAEAALARAKQLTP